VNRGLLHAQQLQEIRHESHAGQEDRVNEQSLDFFARRRRWMCGLFFGLLALAGNPTQGQAQVSASIIARRLGLREL
jgi:hypothetical protein